MEGKDETMRDSPHLNSTSIAGRESIEESLRKSEQKWLQYLESSPDAIYVHDLNGNFLYGNRAAEGMIGYSKEELIGKSFLDLGLLPPESLAKAIHLLEFSAAGKPTGPDEFELIRKGGSHISVEISTYPIGEGNNVEVVGIVRDISERKRFEQERVEASVAKRSSERFRRLVEEMNDGYCVIQGYMIVFANSRAAEMFGYAQEEVMGKRIHDFVSPSIVQQLSRVYEMGEDCGIVPAQYQMSLNKRDGTVREVELGAKVTEFEGKPAISIVIRDITDRKLMEKALGQKEQDYLVLLESTDENIIVVDAQTLKIVFGNGRAAKTFGFDSVPEALGSNILDFIHPDDSNEVVNAFLKDPYEQERRQRYQVRANTKDGKEMWVSALATRIEFEGKVAVLLSIRDITQSKLMEDALSDSEQKLCLYFENVTDVIYSLDSEFRVISVSPSAEKLLGYKPEELIGKLFSELNVLAPEYLEAAASDVMRVLAGERIEDSEYEFITKDGRRRFGQVSGAPLLSEEGRVIGLVSVARDITERRKAQDTLQEGERRYRLLAENVKDIIWTRDMNLRATYVSPSVTEISGYSVEEAMSLSLEESMTPASLELVRTTLAKVTDAEGKRQSNSSEAVVLELELVHKDGSIVLVEMKVNLMCDVDGRLVGLLGVTRDITERRKSEEALRQSEEHYSALVRSLTDAVFTLKGGVITWCNDRVEEIYGYRKEELLGKNASTQLHKSA